MPSARRTSILIVVVYASVLLWCFGGVLTGARVLAYRDTAHFYYPLYHWLTSVWGQGQVPLWNPLENTGVPVAAEATAAVFYPGKLVFALPCSFHFRFHLYLALHVALAGLAMYCLARAWRLQPVSAGMAATAYAFSGTVLFQYCNVVFLVSAAWLPLSLLTAERMLRRRQVHGAILFGATLALMTLGGDPQAAYHAALLAVLYAMLVAWRVRRRRHLTNSPAKRQPWPKRIPTLLGLAAISGSLLAAVQIVPAISWTAASGRPVFEHPRSLYEIPGFLQRGDAEATLPRAAAGLVRTESAGLHGQQLYDFSVGPWRWPEAVWPNFSGHMFPENRRWMSVAVPADARVWSPSLYMGLLPLVLGLAMWRPINASLRVRWISWTVLWSLLGSLGAFGVVWLLAEWGHAIGRPWENTDLQGAVGGVYWLMVVVLPGYAYFRFPAKLLVITTLGLSLLAGIGLDQLLRRNTPADRPRSAVGSVSFDARLTKWLWLICVTSGAAALIIAISGSWWPRWLQPTTPDELFGPLDVRGAWTAALTACGHAAILAGILAVVTGRMARWPQRGALLLIITAVDLAVANGGLILSAPSSALNTPSVLAKVKQADKVSLRYYRSPNRLWVPDPWKQGRDVARAEITLAWDRETLFPRFGLLEKRSSVRSLGTMVPYEYSLLFRGSGSRHDRLPDQQILDALGTDFVVGPQGGSASQADNLSLVLRLAKKNVEVLQNDRRPKRAWIVREIVTLPQLSSVDARSPSRQRQRTLDVLKPAGRARDFAQAAVVELPAGQALPSWDGGVGQSPARFEKETCRIREYARHRIVVEAHLGRAGLLVLNDQYWPGWTARVSVNGTAPRKVPLLKTNRVMRGVYLPSGRHTITFQYRPLGHYLALAVSALAWLTLGVAFALRWKS